jgi:hypothetical protein
VDQLKLLGVALGLACLAGINLYLTVFATGLAIHQHWIVLAPAYHSLEVLGDPLIIWIAGTLYVLEFFADKIPWVDSAWDSVHTVIRPIGGALLAVRVLGQSSPTFDVLVILIAGGTSLMTHTAKAATRLVANTSPEPFSNIGLSLAEDAAVIGGLALIHYNPALALAVVILGIALFVYFAPKLLRAMRVKAWLAWKKLNGPAESNGSITLPTILPTRLGMIFNKQNLLGETIAWAVPCVSGRSRRIPSNLFGVLIATNEETRKLTYVARTGWRSVYQTIDLEGYVVAREPKFLSENLSIYPATGKGPKYLFIFERTRGPVVEQIAEHLRRPLAVPSPEQENPAEPAATA